MSQNFFTLGMAGMLEASFDLAEGKISIDAWQERFGGTALLQLAGGLGAKYAPGGTPTFDRTFSYVVEKVPAVNRVVQVLNTEINFSRTQAPATTGADFYVTPKGEVIPATGYKYMDSSMASQVFKTMEAPGRYFTFDEFKSGSQARNALQISSEWSDARLVGEFDTLQIIDGISIPKEFGGRGINLEPITRAYPEFGQGGYRQAYTNEIISFRRVSLLED